MGAIDPSIGPITQPTVQGPTTPTTTPPPGTPITLTDQVNNQAVTQGFQFVLITPGQRIAIPAPNDDSLLSFLNTIGDSIGELRELLNEVEVFDQLLSRAVTASIIGASVGLNAYHGEIVGYAELLEEVGGTMNGFINAQNTLNAAMNAQITKPKGPPPGNAPGGDIVQVNDMNAAINAYNAGTITQAEYLAVASAYNDYVNGNASQSIPDRNAEIEAYNGAVQIYNQQIQGQTANIALINQLGANLGLPPITGGGPLDELPLMETINLADLTPPLDTLDARQPLPIVALTLVPIPDELSLLEQLYFPLHDLTFPQITALRDAIELTEQLINFQDFVLPGRSIVFPDSFFDSTPQVFLSTTASAGIVSAINTLGALSSVTLERTLSLGLFRRSAERLQIPLSANLFDQIASLNLQLLSRLGSASGLPAAKLLSDGLSALGAGGIPVRVSLAAAFAGRVRGLVASNTVQNSVSQVLRRALSGGGLSFGQIAQLTKATTAGINLSLLGFASLQTAAALNLPGLVPQLLANVPGILPSSLALSSSVAERLTDVLGNGVSRLLLKSSVAARLQQVRGISSSFAQTIANNVVNGVAAFPFGSVSQLRNALYSEFRNAGLSRFQARIMTNSATNFLNDEARLPFLDTAFVMASLNQASLVNTMATTLAQRGYDVGSGTLLANNALRRTLDRDFESVREFRNDLRRDLRRQGVGSRDARILANQAAELLERGQIEVSLGHSVLQETVARESLINDIRNTSGISRGRAAEIADTALENTISRGPYSSSDDFERRLQKELRKEEISVGFNIGKTSELAASAVANVQYANIVTNPLLSPGLPSILSPSLLAENLSSQLIAGLTPSLGISLAQRFSNDAALSLLGFSARDREDIDLKNPTSIINLIQDQIANLRRIDEDLAGRELDDLFRTFSNPTLDVLVLSERILRPAEQEIGILGGPTPHKQDVQFFGGV